jgi:hypothetical protein
MSNEIQIQSKPAVTDGAQTPLVIESLKSTHGFDSANQNSLSFSRGAEVAASSRTNTDRSSPSDKAPADSAAINSGMSVSGRQLERARPVAANHLEGSNKGDHRRPSQDVAAASLSKAADSGGPRNAVGQAPFRGN